MRTPERERLIAIRANLRLFQRQREREILCAIAAGHVRAERAQVKASHEEVSVEIPEAVREVLRFYADPENYERTLVAEDTMGGNVPVGCQDPEAHIRDLFGADVVALCGDGRDVYPHECNGEENGPTKKWSGCLQVRPYGPIPALKDAGARARAALAAENQA